MHPLVSTLSATDTTDTAAPSGPRVPFVIAGVDLHATDAQRLRVVLHPTGPDTFSVHASDPSGAPVITIEALTVRALPDTTAGPDSTPTTTGLLELS
ncbi:hypothetical protein, partial [Mycobacterium szulgai]|uniref:hypothetical protein n=1 Tax=Mycobacterium szulgai TaxID=1787 RepID=UPI0021F27B13